MKVTKPVDIEQLAEELRAANVPFRLLALTPTHSGTPNEAELMDHSEDGVDIELPPEATPVVDAHTPIPPLTKFTQNVTVAAKVRTTDNTPTVLRRVTLSRNTGYDVVLRIIAVDTASFSVKKLVMDFTVKRLGAGALQVGVTAFPVNQSDTAASGLIGNLTFEGADLVITVTGATGRTVDWAMLGNLNRFTPSGDDTP